MSNYSKTDAAGSSNIDTLLEVGSDAMTNLYELVLSEGTFSSATTQALTVRCKSFTPPSISQGTYKVYYKTANVDKAKPEVTLDRKFSVSFRVDSQYDIYKALQKQKAITFNPQYSYTATDIENLMKNNKMFTGVLRILVKPINSDVDQKYIDLHKYQYCWIESIRPLSFKTGTNNPLEVEVTIAFLKTTDEDF